MLSRSFAIVLGLSPVFALLPLARPAPQGSGPVCTDTCSITDYEPCPDYQLEVSLSTESLPSCGGCRISWTARVVKISTGVTISTSSGTDENACGAGGVAHTFRSPCDTSKLWKELYLGCGNCP